MKGVEITQADVTELLSEAINSPLFGEMIQKVTGSLYPKDVFDDDGTFWTFQFIYPEISETYIMVDVELEINAKAVTIGDGYMSRTTYENYVKSVDIDDVSLFIRHYGDIYATWDTRIIKHLMKKYEED